MKLHNYTKTSKEDLNFFFSYFNVTYQQPIQAYLKALLDSFHANFFQHNFKLDTIDDTSCKITSHFFDGDAEIVVDTQGQLTPKLLAKIENAFKYINKSTEYDSDMTVGDATIEAFYRGLTYQEAPLPEQFAIGLYNALTDMIEDINEKQIKANKIPHTVGTSRSNHTTGLTIHQNKDRLLYNATNPTGDPNTKLPETDILSSDSYTPTTYTIYIHRYNEETKKKKSYILAQVNFRWGKLYQDLEVLSSELSTCLGLDYSVRDNYIQNLYQSLIKLADSCKTLCFIPQEIRKTYDSKEQGQFKGFSKLLHAKF